MLYAKIIVRQHTTTERPDGWGVSIERTLFGQTIFLRHCLTELEAGNFAVRVRDLLNEGFPAGTFKVEPQ